MPKFLTFKSPSSSDLKENPLKALYESFLSFDRFTKGFLIVLLLILISTPFLVNNLLIFKPHAQETQPTLGEQTTPIPPSVPDEILVKFKPGVSEQAKDNIKNQHALEILETILQIEVLRVKVTANSKDAVIEALKHNPNIEYAEANYINQAAFTPNDYYYPNQWNLAKLTISPAWDITQGDSAVVIAILDTGIDINHEELIGKYIGSPTPDDYGHGTEVAGVAAANTNNTKGLAGVCPLCQIFSYKVLDSTGSGTDSAVANGIIKAADAGAKVINLSLGAYTDSLSMHSAVDYAWNKGVVVVGAAGNDNSTYMFYPAAYPNVLSVGASTPSDTKVSVSNYGDWIKVWAPGAGILSPQMGGGYAQAGGTSLASPHVAGLAGLILSAKPGLTNQQVTDIITQTADKVGVGKRINAYKALAATTGITVTADTQAPTVSISSPTGGSTVSSLVDITADATDNVGVTKVEFLIDGVLLGSDISSPYLASWDTTAVSNISHIISAKAYDNAGNIGAATSVTVTVSNTTPTPTPADTTPPTVFISSPTDGSTISGNTNIVASASDNVSVSTISIFVDGAVVTSCSVSGISSNCSYSLDTTQYPNGSHTISAKTLDSSSNLGQSTTITVNVNNTTPSPTPISTPTPTPTLVPPTPTNIVSSDTTAPTVTITSPLNGSTLPLKGSVKIKVTASDISGISQIQLYFDSTLVTTCSGVTSCSGNKSVTQVIKGTHTITARATDNSVNKNIATTTISVVK